jgi:hypothetical protein
MPALPNQGWTAAFSPYSVASEFDAAPRVIGSLPFFLEDAGALRWLLPF